MTGWALVTGSSKRIGRAIALDLAAHGWDIIVHFHKAEAEAKQVAQEILNLGRVACLAQIDLSDARQAENLIPSLAEELGMIDALVNNAALFETDETDPDGTRHWALNADAPRLLSKSFREHLAPKERGSIVNILDATLDQTDTPALSAYRRSKVFLADITRNMAKSFAPQVRVNGVAPAFVLPRPQQTEAAFDALAKGHRATPEQVATEVRKLLETPTITGQIVTVG